MAPSEYQELRRLLEQHTLALAEIGHCLGICLEGLSPDVGRRFTLLAHQMGKELCKGGNAEAGRVVLQFAIRAGSPAN